MMSFGEGDGGITMLTTEGIHFVRHANTFIPLEIWLPPLLVIASEFRGISVGIRAAHATCTVACARNL
jgi:hypothetical protein